MGSEEDGTVASSSSSVWRRNRRLVLLAALLAIVPGAIDRLIAPTFPVHDSGSVVLSGASSGIGRAACGYLAERHPGVTFHCGVRRRSAAVGYPFDGSLPNVRSVILDVTRQDHVDEAVRGVDAPLIAVVANAGAIDLGTIEFQPTESILRLYEVNVFGTLRLTKAASPILRANGDGRIVWTTSITGQVPALSPVGAYASTKAALESLGDPLRRELRPWNVSVSLVAPGFVTTPLTGAAASWLDDPEPPESEVYARAFDPELIEPFKRIVGAGFPVEETCRAIEHGLFSERPRTRYLTAGVGFLSSRVFVGLTRLLPTDRITDSIFESSLVFRMLADGRDLLDRVAVRAAD